MPQCPGCSQEIADEDVFCRRCGRRLQDAADGRDAFMDEMASAFAQRLKDQAGDTDAAYNLALTFFYSRRYAQAIPHLRRVVQDMPDYAEARAKLAAALWQTGECEAGLAEMEQAVAQAPDDARLRRWREQMRQALGST